MTALDDVLKVLTDLRGQTMNDFLYEIDRLRAIKEWALRELNLTYVEGDRVEIFAPPHINRNSGWWHYREYLRRGAVGTAGEIHFSPHRKRWYCDFLAERSWSVHDHSGMHDGSNLVRYWNGPADETPEGMTPPSDYDREHHPLGKIKVFMLDATSLRRAREFDASGLPVNEPLGGGC